MTLGFLFGDFESGVTSPVMGAGTVGLHLAIFFGVNSVASKCWGYAITAGCITRRTAYLGSALCIAVFLVVTLAWDAPRNFEQGGGAAGTGWTPVPNRSPRAGDMALVLALAALFGCGDAFWESGPPMTLQTFYAGTEHVVPAMANYKLWQSLGLGLQFYLGVQLKDNFHARVVILLVLEALSVACV